MNRHTAERVVTCSLVAMMLVGLALLYAAVWVNGWLQDRLIFTGLLTLFIPVGALPAAVHIPDPTQEQAIP